MTKLEMNAKHTLHTVKDQFLEETNLFSERFDLNDHLDKVIEENFGDRNMGLMDTSNIISHLTSACSSTGLLLAMHFCTLGGIKNIVREDMRKTLFNQIIESGHLITLFNHPNSFLLNSMETYQNTTSIRASRVQEGFVVTGVREFYSVHNRAKFIPVYCYQGELPNNEGITALLLQTDDVGVSIEEVLEDSGVRGVQLYRATFNNVFVSCERLIGREGHAIEDTKELMCWTRLIASSVYVGIAKSAFNHILKTTKEKMLKEENNPLVFSPAIQVAISDMDIQVDVMQAQIDMFAIQADKEMASGQVSDELLLQALITEYFTLKTVREVLHRAIQLEGIKSVMKKGFLERLLTQVSVTSSDQSSDEFLIELISKKVIKSA